MTRTQAIELVERLLVAAGAFDRDPLNYSTLSRYTAAREDVINALMRGDAGVQREA